LRDAHSSDTGLQQMNTSDEPGLWIVAALQVTHRRDAVPTGRSSTSSRDCIRRHMAT
jgi:hypothetical protein